MASVISPTSIIIGAGNPYYRAVGVLTAWTGMGATSDDTTMRINQSWFHPDLNGQLQPLQGLDYLVEQSAELEFTMNEVAGSKFALAVPGATSTTSATTAAGTPLSTTLATAASIGDTDIYVAGVTNAAVGDYVRINVTAGSLDEIRQLTRVGTAGASGTGTGLGFRDPLQKAHASGVAVAELVGDGKTTITGSTVRRMADSAYNQWAMVMEAPNGFYELRLTSGISSTDSAEITSGDETMGGIRVTIASRGNGATPNTPAWSLIVP